MVHYLFYQVDKEFVDYYINLLDLEEYGNEIGDFIINKMRICIYWKNGAKISFEGLVPGFGVCRASLYYNEKLIKSPNCRVIDNELKLFMKEASLITKLIAKSN